MSVVDASGDATNAVARHIARVAARLFATRGYDATPVRAIVEEAGVTKPTLYYHFGSKEGLAHAVLTMPMSGLAASIRAIVDAEGDPVVMLERILDVHFAFCREDPDRARFLFTLLFGPLNAGLAAEMERFGGECACPMIEAVRRLADLGLIAPDRDADFLKAFRGLMIISIMDFLLKGEEFGPDLGHRLVDGLLHGFGRDSDGDAGAGKFRGR